MNWLPAGGRCQPRYKTTAITPQFAPQRTVNPDTTRETGFSAAVIPTRESDKKEIDNMFDQPLWPTRNDMHINAQKSCKERLNAKTGNNVDSPEYKKKKCPVNKKDLCAFLERNNIPVKDYYVEGHRKVKPGKEGWIKKATFGKNFPPGPNPGSNPNPGILSLIP